MPIALSLLLAALVGFAIHRASLCTVRAVAEILTTRRAYMLSAFGKTTLWVAATTVGMVLLLGNASAPGAGWPVSLRAAAGGFAFGVGAALNRGCAFSMLARLANGEARMLLALAGFCLGAAAAHPGADALGLAPDEALPPAYDAAVIWLPGVLIVLVLWSAWEGWRLWRTRPTSAAWTKLALARMYRLSTAAALMGVANGAIYALHGPWAYTGTLAGWAQSVATPGPAPNWPGWAFAGALILGAVASAWQRGSIRLDWRPSAAWIVNGAGGMLMGFGAVLAPGGNDALIQHHIPGLSPHALPAFGAMLLGIATVLAIGRMVTNGTAPVDCHGDLCREPSSPDDGAGTVAGDRA
jgi:uncharacterized membrane protein YedE/YeeE